MSNMNSLKSQCSTWKSYCRSVNLCFGTWWWRKN